MRPPTSVYRATLSTAKASFGQATFSGASAVSADTSATISGSTLISGTLSREAPNRVQEIVSGHGWSGPAGVRAGPRALDLGRGEGCASADHVKLTVADEPGDDGVGRLRLPVTPPMRTSVVSR